MIRILFAIFSISFFAQAQTGRESHDSELALSWAKINGYVKGRASHSFKTKGLFTYKKGKNKWMAFFGYGGRTAEELYDDVKDLEDQKKGVIRIEGWKAHNIERYNFLIDTPPEKVKTITPKNIKKLSLEKSKKNIKYKRAYPDPKYKRKRTKRR